MIFCKVVTIYYSGNRFPVLWFFVSGSIGNDSIVWVSSIVVFRIRE